MTSATFPLHVLMCLPVQIIKQWLSFFHSLIFDIRSLFGFTSRYVSFGFFNSQITPSKSITILILSPSHKLRLDKKNVQKQSSVFKHRYLQINLDWILSYHMKIMITGGMGFIGSHLCEQLLIEKHDLVVLTKSFLKKHNISNISKTIKIKTCRDVFTFIRGN